VSPEIKYETMPTLRVISKYTLMYGITIIYFKFVCKWNKLTLMNTIRILYCNIIHILLWWDCLVLLVRLYHSIKMHQFVSWIVTICIVYNSPKIKFLIHLK